MLSSWGFAEGRTVTLNPQADTGTEATTCFRFQSGVCPMVTDQIIPHLKKVQVVVKRRICITFCIPIFYLQVIFGVINGVQSLSSNCSFAPTHSPEKQARSTEIRTILTAWRNVTAFMEMQLKRSPLIVNISQCPLLMLHSWENKNMKCKIILLFLGLGLLQSLQTVHLSFNGILQIDLNDFHNCLQLKNIYLQSNKIANIHPDAFKDLNKLQVVKQHYNSFSVLC